MKKYIFFILLLVVTIKVYPEVNYQPFHDNEIKTLNYDIRTRYNPTSHNIVINPEQQYNPNYNHKRLTKSANTSYLSIEHQERTTSNLHINNNTANYYHRYSPANSVEQRVSYNEPTGMRPYNVSSKEPFSEENKVNVSTTQNAWGGPPSEGPVGDAFLPILILAGLYIFIRKKQN